MARVNRIRLDRAIWLSPLKGLNMGHVPDDTVKGIQWVSVIAPDARRGHLQGVIIDKELIPK